MYGNRISSKLFVLRCMGHGETLKHGSVWAFCANRSYLGQIQGQKHPPLCFTHHHVLQGPSTASLEDQRGGILCSGIHRAQVFEPLQPFPRGESLCGVSEGRQHKQEPYLVSSFWTIEKDFQCKALLRGFFHADSGITAIKSFSQQGC